MKKYPFVKPNMPDLEDLLPNLRDIWDSNNYANNGKYVQSLERLVANYYNISKERVVCCSNATVGLMVAVKALDWKNDVVLPSFTFPATVHAIEWNNLNYSFVDISPDTQHLSLENLNIREKNVMAVFPYGCPEHYDFYDKCKSVIIDSASSLGNRNDAMMEAVDEADALVFSLHATKFFGIGEGGIVIFKQEKTASKFRKLINFGYDQNKDMIQGGMNGKLCEVLAAIGTLKIQKANKLIDDISSVASIFRKELVDFESPLHKKSLKHHPWQFIPIILPQEYSTRRDIIKKDMLDKYGIVVGSYYDPLHTKKGEDSLRLPHTMNISQRTLSLPIYPTMTEEDVIYITRSLKSSVKK